MPYQRAMQSTLANAKAIQAFKPMTPSSLYINIERSLARHGA